MTEWAFFSSSFLFQEATSKQKWAKHKHGNQHRESGMCGTGDIGGLSEQSEDCALSRTLLVSRILCCHKPLAHATSLSATLLINSLALGVSKNPASYRKWETSN